MELPVVATRIPGCVDGVQDGVTGVLVPPRDAKALGDALRAYLSDAILRSSHGTAGRIRALRDFREADITEAMFQGIGTYCMIKVYPSPFPKPFRSSQILRTMEDWRRLVNLVACGALGPLRLNSLHNY